MICYRDMTWCGYYTSCLDEDNCDRKLTQGVIQAANVASLDICQFAETPPCYIAKPGIRDAKDQPFRSPKESE